MMDDEAQPEDEQVQPHQADPIKKYYKRNSKWSPEMRLALKMAAGYGLRMPQLAAIAGVTLQVFEQRLQRDKALRRALDEGRAMAELEVSKTLFEKATQGDINAIKWYEQTRTGRSAKEETQQHNLQIDFSAAIQKFEALNAKRVEAIEPSKAEVWIAGGETAARARVEEAEQRAPSNLLNEYDAMYAPRKETENG